MAGFGKMEVSNIFWMHSISVRS